MSPLLQQPQQPLASASPCKATDSTPPRMLSCTASEIAACLQMLMLARRGFCSRPSSLWQTRPPTKLQRAAALVQELAAQPQAGGEGGSATQQASRAGTGLCLPSWGFGVHQLCRGWPYSPRQPVREAMAQSRHVDQQQGLAAWCGTLNASASCTTPCRQLQLAGGSKEIACSRRGGQQTSMGFSDGDREGQPIGAQPQTALAQMAACSMPAGRQMSVACMAGNGVLQQRAAVQAAAVACIRHVEVKNAAGKLGCTTASGAESETISSRTQRCRHVKLSSQANASHLQNS